MTKSRKLSLCSTVVLIGFCLSVFIHYANHYYSHYGFPDSTYLFIPEDRWGDFRGLTFTNARLDPFHNTYLGGRTVYFPFCHLITSPFSSLGMRWGAGLFLGIWLVGFWAFIWKTLRNASDRSGLNLLCLIVLGLTTYPFHFAFDRLNAENIIFLFLSGFYLAFQSRRWTLSACLLAFATAMKGYPGMLVLLFIPERRWREIFQFGVLSVLLNLISLAVFRTSPAEAMSSYASGAAMYMEYLLSSLSIQHTSSLYGAVRTLQGWIWGETSLSNVALGQFILRASNFAGVIVGLLATAGVLSRKTVHWEKLTLIFATIIVATPVSFDYKLLHLFLPFAAFINSRTNRRTSTVFVYLFAILFIAKQWKPIFSFVGPGSIINPAVLLLMIGVILYKAWKASPELKASQLGT